MQPTRSPDRSGVPPLRRLAHHLMVTALSASFFVNGVVPTRAETPPTAEPAPVGAVTPPTVSETPPPSEATGSGDATAEAPAAALLDSSAMSSTEIVATVDDPDPKAAKEPDPAPFSGSYTRSVKLDLPGFHGIEPTLAALYDSNAGWHAGEFDAGFLGVGWRLDGSSEIVRSGFRGGSPR